MGGHGTAHGGEGPAGPSPAVPATVPQEDYLRLAADFDNYRKRVSRDSEAARERLAGSLAESLLPLADSLDRAAEDPSFAPLRSQLLAALASFGTERVGPEPGGEFDPHAHRSLGSIPSSHPAGRVAAVARAGYRQGARLLRPADVLLSAGPPED